MNSKNLNLQIAWFNEKHFSVHVIGKYPMVAPNDALWKSLNIQDYINKERILAHDFDVPKHKKITIEEAKITKREQVNAWRNQQENNPNLTINAVGFNWDANPQARARIQAVLQSEVMPRYWTDADNSDHDGFTLTELQTVFSVINNHAFTLHDAQRKMKEKIQKLKTVEEVNNFLIG